MPQGLHTPVVCICSSLLEHLFLCLLMNHLSSLLQSSVHARALSSGKPSPAPFHLHPIFNQASSFGFSHPPCGISLSPWPVLNSYVGSWRSRAGVSSFLVSSFLSGTEEGDGPSMSRYSRYTRNFNPKPGYFPPFSVPLAGPSATCTSTAFRVQHLSLCRTPGESAYALQPAQPCDTTSVLVLG